jgi:hypothetical protein
VGPGSGVDRAARRIDRIRYFQPRRLRAGVPRAARFRFHEYSTRIRNIFKSKGVLAMD